MDYSDLYDRIGYTFTNPQYLSHALRRTAFAREQNVSLDETMDYLAVLGDAVIEIVTIQNIIDLGSLLTGNLSLVSYTAVNDILDCNYLNNSIPKDCKIIHCLI